MSMPMKYQKTSGKSSTKGVVVQHEQEVSDLDEPDNGLDDEIDSPPKKTNRSTKKAQFVDAESPVPVKEKSKNKKPVHVEESPVPAKGKPAKREREEVVESPVPAKGKPAKREREEVVESPVPEKPKSKKAREDVVEESDKDEPAEEQHSDASGQDENAVVEPHAGEDDLEALPTDVVAPPPVDPPATKVTVQQTAVVPVSQPQTGPIQTGPTPQREDATFMFPDDVWGQMPEEGRKIACKDQSPDNLGNLKKYVASRYKIVKEPSKNGNGQVFYTPKYLSNSGSNISPELVFPPMNVQSCSIGRARLGYQQEGIGDGRIRLFIGFKSKLEDPKINNPKVVRNRQIYNQILEMDRVLLTKLYAACASEVAAAAPDLESFLKLANRPFSIEEDLVLLSIKHNTYSPNPHNPPGMFIRKKNKIDVPKDAKSKAIHEIAIAQGYVYKNPEVYGPDGTRIVPRGDELATKNLTHRCEVSWIPSQSVASVVAGVTAYVSPKVFGWNLYFKKAVIKSLTDASDALDADIETYGNAITFADMMNRYKSGADDDDFDDQPPLD